MLELLTGTGLAVAAGLNAYVPLLILGAADRFLGIVELPAGWAWLANEWVLLIIGVLLVVELVADKIPVVDSINDWLQTVVRPAAGGIVFGSGAASETVAVTDPAAFFADTQWVPIAIGALLALSVHVVKALSRPVANAVTAGAAAPLVSSFEDVGAVVLTVLAIVVPILVIAAIVIGLILTVMMIRAARRRRRPIATE